MNFNKRTVHFGETFTSFIWAVSTKLFHYDLLELISYFPSFEYVELCSRLYFQLSSQAMFTTETVQETSFK